MKKYLIWTLVILALVLTAPVIFAEGEYMYVEGTTLKFLPLPDLQPASMGYFSEELQANFLAAEIAKNPEIESIAEYADFLKAVDEYTLLLEDVNPAKGSASYLFSYREADTKLFIYVYLIDSESRIGQMIVSSPAEDFIDNQQVLLRTAQSLVWTGEAPRITFHYSIGLPEGWNFIQRADTMDVYVKGTTVTEETPTVVVVDYQTLMDQSAVEGLLAQPDWDGDTILSHESMELGDLGASLFTLQEEADGVTSINHGCFIFTEDTTYFMMTLDQFMSAEEFKALVQTFKVN